MQTCKEAYLDVTKKIACYWQIYGGSRAFLRSPYLHVSLALSVVTANTWLFHCWWDTVLSVLPNLLGFTLGGFAIFLGFGDDKFKAAIAGNDPDETEDYSPYMSVTSTFLHFVFVQIVALLWALAAKGLHFDLPWTLPAEFFFWIGSVGDFIGYWLFLYGLSLSAAAALAIFGVAGWFEAFHTDKKTNPESADPPCAKCPMANKD